MDCLIPTSLAIRNTFSREGLARILLDHDFTIAQMVAAIDEVRLTDSSDHVLIFEGDPSFSPEDLYQLDRLIADHPGVRVLLIISSFDFELISRAFTIGIYGCMPHDTPIEHFVSIVRLVALGQKVVPKEMVDVVSGHASQVRPGVPSDIAETYCLGTRELEILQCLMAGMPNKLISRSLGISEAAVKLNVKSIFRKMSVTNRTQAAILAHEIDGAFPHR